MVFQLNKEWQVQPIKGATGQTYMGIRETEKVFIKRNTSPLLAALSTEGIAPKLVWTKRTISGDTLTAQEWLEGRCLKEEEIGSRNDVIDVLYHLHHSYVLKKMLEKIGGKIQTPEKLFRKYQEEVPEGLKKNTYLSKVAAYLENHFPKNSTHNYMVVHGDVNHRNWLVSNNYLYLVDWDSVMVADPAMDLGMLLGHYVPQSRWHNWLLSYGMRPANDDISRIKWYALLSFLQEITRNYLIGERIELNAEILRLKQTFE